MRGMCTGKNAVSATKPMPSSTCASACDGIAMSCVSAQAAANAPEAASDNQSRVAAAL